MIKQHEFSSMLLSLKICIFCNTAPPFIQAGKSPKIMKIILISQTPQRSSDCSWREMRISVWIPLLYFILGFVCCIWVSSNADTLSAKKCF